MSPRLAERDAYRTSSSQGVGELGELGGQTSTA